MKGAVDTVLKLFKNGNDKKKSNATTKAPMTIKSNTSTK